MHGWEVTTMTDTTSNSVSLASVAHVHAQAVSYTDERCRELTMHLNRTQAQLRQEAKERESHKLRMKLVDRLAFLALGILVGKLVNLIPVVPILAVTLGALPDVMREVFEFFKRL
jgi:hypothetical protein